VAENCVGLRFDCQQFLHSKEAVLFASFISRLNQDHQIRLDGAPVAFQGSLEAIQLTVTSAYVRKPDVRQSPVSSLNQMFSSQLPDRQVVGANEVRVESTNWPIKKQIGHNMFVRTRFQFGSLRLRKRERGSDVWEFRYYETNPEGKRIRQSVILGEQTLYRTEDDARKATQALLMRLNDEAPCEEMVPPAFGALLDRYIEHELPERHSTRSSHLSNIRKHIRPRWGEQPVQFSTGWSGITTKVLR
jgi:hypothetical protein